MMARRAPRHIPYDIIHAIQTIRAAAVVPSQRSACLSRSVTDLGWAAVRRYVDGGANPPVSLHGAAWPTGIDAFTSPEGMLVTPVRQFFRASQLVHPACGVRRMAHRATSKKRISVEQLATMGLGESSLLLGEWAFAATDHEAAAIRYVALEQFSRCRGMAGGAASISPGVHGINCTGRLAEGIAEGAEILHGRGHGGTGLVVYEPLARGAMAHAHSRQPPAYAGISVGYRVVPGRPCPERGAESAGIIRIKSRALDQPLGTGGLHGQCNASIMFDPYAAFAMRAAPRLWLEARREWSGQGLSIKATHTVCIDMDESAVCLLFHAGA